MDDTAPADAAYGGFEKPAKAATSRTRSTFFARTALVMLACVILSFPLTYFQPMVTGSRRFSVFYHIHGAAFFGWMFLYAWQTHLAAKGKITRHRELGLAGIALSALLLPLGIIMAVLAILRRIAAGGDHPFDFTAYNIVDIATFAILMTASIAAVSRHPDWHRRFTFGAALCLVGPAISRWFLPFPPFPPFTDFGPNILADLFLIALVNHDRRTMGRVHPASYWVIAGLVPVHLLTPYFASSDTWRSIAPNLLHVI
jgi:hypothetical protein